MGQCRCRCWKRNSTAGYARSCKLTPMKVDRVIRVAIALAIIVVFIVATGALLFVTESALNVWDRLAKGPPLLLYLYVAVMLAIVVTALLLIWRLVIRRRIKPPEVRAAGPLSRDDIESRLRDAESAGVDVSEAQAELRELASRREAGAIHLCFFGEVSTGKSSLIKALVPEADVKIDRRHSTFSLAERRWRRDPADRSSRHWRSRGRPRRDGNRGGASRARRAVCLRQ